MIATVAITANGRRRQCANSATGNPASRGRQIEREMTSDKPSGDSPKARSNPCRCPASPSSTKARPAREARSARASVIWRTTLPVQQGQPAASVLTLDPDAAESGWFTSPSQSSLSAHMRAMKAVFPVPAAPVTTCTGMRSTASSAFLAPADRQAKGLELPVKVGALKAGPVGHARHAAVLPRELVFEVQALECVARFAVGLV